MDEIKEGIKYVFQTNNELTLAISSAGHGGMEAVLCNLLEPGDTVLVAVNGIWGQRAAEMGRRYGTFTHTYRWTILICSYYLICSLGASVVCIHAAIGKNFSLEELEEAIQLHKPILLFIVQGESSTGVYQPIEGLGDICHK